MGAAMVLCHGSLPWGSAMVLCHGSLPWGSAMGREVCALRGSRECNGHSHYYDK